MSLDALLENLVQAVSKAYGQEIEAARKVYFQRCGEPFQDEASYELRLRNFIEWYLFDYPLQFGLTPYEAFMADAAQPAEERQAFLPFRDQAHSLFLVEDVREGGLPVVDLWTGRKYRVELEVTAGYDPGAVVEMRLVELEGKNYATGTHVYHNPSSAKFIVKAAKTLRKERRVDLWDPFLCRANYLQLKTERYKHVESNTIYREILADMKTIKQQTEQAA